MSKKTKPPVQKNQHITGEVIDFTFMGMGVVKVEGFPIFVANTIVGETIELIVTKVSSTYAFGKMIELIKRSPDRNDNDYVNLINSGIAPLVHISYPAQLKLKQDQITQLFKKQGIDVEVEETIGMEHPDHYRNKTVVPIKNQDGKLTTGFYRRGSHRLVEIDDYFLNDPIIDKTVGIVRDILQANKVTAYDDETRSGTIRYIMVRRGYYSGEVMVVLVSQKNKLPNQENIVKQITEKVEGIESLILNVNPRQTNVLLGDKNQVLFGKSTITDTLLGRKFIIGPNSFYQVNPQTTELLYDIAAKKADLNKDTVAIDAYSGIGTIGLTVADQVDSVIGVEVVGPAVEDANENKKANKVENANFVHADAPEQFQNWAKEGVKPDVVFVDPPRKGLTNELIKSVGEMAPDTFVYISCNPATLARDAVELINQGYEINQPITPIDQFPQTTHVESITVFKRKI